MTHLEIFRYVLREAKVNFLEYDRADRKYIQIQPEAPSDYLDHSTIMKQPVTITFDYEERLIGLK